MKFASLDAEQETRYGDVPMSSSLVPRRDGANTLAHVIETLLDKGLVLNADIMVSVGGVELLGIRIRAALASFETAARYGLEFPGGTSLDTVRHAALETCPGCGKHSERERLLNDQCPWCGWRSAHAQRTLPPAQAAPPPKLRRRRRIRQPKS